MSNDNRDVVWAAAGVGFGIWAFFYGFNRLRRARLVQNTPTSTVRGLAMGLVELEGVARPTCVLNSPLTNTVCAAYKFQVEEYRSSGKSGHWVTVAQGDSFHCPFYLEDATGKVKVYPSGAELHWKPDYQFKNGIGTKFPDNLSKFLEGKGIKSRGWLFAKSMRFTEWYFQDGSPVYLLGTAQPDGEAAIQTDKYKLAQRLEQLKQDPKWMKDVDTDQDGNISEEEWTNAVARVESELIGETMDKVSLDNASGIRIARDQGDKPFILAREAEPELVKELFWSSILCVWGGPALSLASLAYFIWRLKTIWNF